MKKQILLLVVFTVFLSGKASALSYIYDWTFNDVVFDDGGTLTGSFRSYSGNTALIDIQTTSGSSITDTHTFDQLVGYSRSNSTYVFSPTSYIGEFSVPDYSNWLSVAIAPSPYAGSPNRDIEITSQFKVDSFTYTGFASGQSVEDDRGGWESLMLDQPFERVIVSGSMTAVKTPVPEPAFAWMWIFGSAVLVFSAAKRRRR